MKKKKAVKKDTNATRTRKRAEARAVRAAAAAAVAERVKLARPGVRERRAAARASLVQKAALADDRELSAAAVRVLDAWQAKGVRIRWWGRRNETGTGQCVLEQYTNSQWRPYRDGVFKGTSLDDARQQAAAACLEADPTLGKLAGLA